MKILIISFSCCFLYLFTTAQVVERQTLYLKIESLIKTYEGKKIKWVMADYKNNRFLIITKKETFTLTKKQAAESGIIAPLPEVKNFSIESPIYHGIINIIQLKNFDRTKEKIVSDDAGIYFNEQSGEFRAETYIPDSAIFYTVNIETSDTIGICKKEVLLLPEAETRQLVISFGDINGKLVTADLLKQQKEIKIPDGYTLVNAVAYFSGTNFRNVHVQQLNSKNLSPLSGLIDSCADGSNIVLDNVIIKTPSGKLMRSDIPVVQVGKVAKPVDFASPQIQFGSFKAGRAESDRFKRQKKIYILGDGYEFVSATIYFGGAGFPNVISATLQSPSLTPVYDLLQKCQPGTVIIFDNVKIKTSHDWVRVIDGPAYALF
jgi:hypothetical protein